MAPKARDGAKSHEDGKQQELHVSIGTRELKSTSQRAEQTELSASLSALVHGARLPRVGGNERSKRSPARSALQLLLSRGASRAPLYTRRVTRYCSGITRARSRACRVTTLVWPEISYVTVPRGKVSGCHPRDPGCKSRSYIWKHERVL